MIRVRIAPSPTGPLHIGTARAALFNYLYARKYGGKFLLRIEDTDRTRSTEAFEKDILAGLKWLGLQWDEEIVHQSKRLEVYQKVADSLVKAGRAYQKEGATYFRIPPHLENRSTVLFTDLVRGAMAFELKDITDFVIMKSDGHPTYHLAVVVDDQEQKITHVIRGEDHLTNTPKHILLQHALGYAVPHYAHLPLVVNQDRTKMSKRRDPVSVSRDFRDKGYLPEAMLNFIALLGWNPGEGSKQEFFTLSELEKAFEIEHVGGSPSVFDQTRLDFFNAHYLRARTPPALLAELKAFTKLPETTDEFLLRVVTVVKDRLVTISDFVRFTEYFFKTPPLVKAPLVFHKSTPADSLKGLDAAHAALEKAPADTWESIDALNHVIAETVKRATLNNGDVFWPVRVALSAESASPSPAELLWVLGKVESLKRLKEGIRALEKQKQVQSALKK